ncbi:MAG: ABC transporter permease [Candidatus Sabulitectum sp.]|nr:ABC transporter permease [Candidatus Sabulitectum sp.]
MKQKLLWALARRHVWSNANSTVVRMVSALSVAGVAIGVAALVILQAFMGGFTEAIASGLTAMNPPLHIYVPGGVYMDDFDLGAVQSIAAEIPGITHVEGVLEKPAVVSGAPGTVSGAMVRGCTSEGLIIGMDLARELDVEAGDEIRIASTAGVEISGMGRVLVDTIVTLAVDSVGDFSIEEYNSSLVVLPLNIARNIFSAHGELTSLGAYVSSGSDPVVVSEMLNSALYEEYVGGGWPVYMSCIPFLAFHGNLFKALGLERIAMTIVLALITVVALLNLSSALTMIALEHRRDIGVMRAMGLAPSGVFRISILRGFILGGSGAVIGLVFSWISIFAVNRYFPIRLDGTVYWIDVLPGVFPVTTALVVTLSTILVCLVVSVFPALSALSRSPSDALRYE